MRKGLASDFDGTLYYINQKPEISERNLKSIQAFQKEGSCFGICTGRSLTGITKVVPKSLHFDFFIIASGALILDRKQQEIEKHCVDKNLLIDLYQKYSDKNGTQIIFHANDTVYSFYDEFSLQTRIHSFDDLTGSIYGMSMGTESKDMAARITEEVNKHYGSEITAFHNVYNVDIAPKGCSKGHALGVIKEVYGIDCMGGIGDSYNDLPMIWAADVGFTFPSSPANVKKAADHIVDDVASAINLLK
ncbi:MAG: HAD-IIB family hydrolase [Lachnospiraceae bacterium]|nr:HAD-IIB family hydrolase [Lachnospiraceae bacterium]